MGNGIIYGNVQFAFPWRNQIRRRHCYWVEAMTAYSPNNGDAAGVGALFAEDAVFVTPQGPIFGREAIEKLFEGMFQQGHYSNHLNKDDQGSPHMIGTAGNEVWRTGEWSFTLQGKSGDPLQLKGYWGAINVREGDTWKIRMLTFNVTPPPAAETK